MRTPRMIAIALAAVLAASCARAPAGPAHVSAPEPGPAGLGEIRLATTTSTDNTGLLAVLLPPFERKFGAKVSVLAAGTGKAIDLGRNGDVDVVLAHAEELEEKFVSDGFGVNRRRVMHNDFVLIGHPDDPAGVAGAGSAPDAFAALAAKGAPFVSRGDRSGTHVKELELWKAAGCNPAGKPWYMEAGQGMEAVLAMTFEKKAYALSDRGTYLSMAGKFDLRIVCEGDGRLFNPYSVIVVNPAKYRKANYLGAMGLAAWLTSPEGQAIIGGFKKDGKVLFHPDAVPED